MVASKPLIALALLSGANALVAPQQRALAREELEQRARRERIAARKARRDAERVALGLVDDEDARAANGVGDAVERDDADVDAAYASGVTVTVRAGIGASDDGF